MLCSFHARKIQAGGHGVIQKIPHQLLHDKRVREQAVIGLIRAWHGRCLCTVLPGCATHAIVFLAGRRQPHPSACGFGTRWRLQKGAFVTDPARAIYADIPTFTDFRSVVDPAVYRPLPDDWQVGLTDVVGSTRAIAEGRYKAVNMAGAAAITAVSNALGHRDFPFVFGGDGAALVVPPDFRAEAAEALARTARWVEEDLGLVLRAAMIPVAAIRAVGRDIRVARFAVSEGVSYAMVSGGGLSWAEAEMKAGRFALAPAPAEARPDLSGLSCRWVPIESRKGAIVSLILEPAEGAEEAAIADLVRRLLATLEAQERHGHPVPESGPTATWPPAGMDLEARVPQGPDRRPRSRLALRLETFLAWGLFRTGLVLGRFDPGRYRSEVALNSDFRKFDDALRLTIDCDEAVIARITAILERARGDRLVRYGLHRQKAALMTCFVPSVASNDHMHFLDGADGGYARAAAALKAQG
ncbi:MAG: DUF3095 family protein [Alphaproteobacteria bacterium]|jgi:hypothetical protein|nr:DUF3095 family protein [Alphaproteobacteria bacterium]